MRKTIQNVKLTKDFLSYGHYRLNVELENGSILSVVTGDTELVSDLDSVVDTIRERAKERAIEFVMANHS
ncbi:hypothetical protein [Bacteroides neonati]|uniref:hypothetical protein n=1 Tax=Bacteroides neonati TaxID=1347393 RepID=UPI0004AF2FA7|nr:hypothetical protein [Bacteroides neonati]